MNFKLIFKYYFLTVVSEPLQVENNFEGFKWGKYVNIS